MLRSVHKDVVSATIELAVCFVGEADLTVFDTPLLHCGQEITDMARG